MPNPKSLVVKSGQTVELSKANTLALGGQRLQLRPLTAEGLRTLVGQLGKTTARLADPKHFEQLKDVNDYFELRPDKNGYINGLSARGFLAMVRALPDGDAVPQKLELPIFKSGCGCKSSSRNRDAAVIERSRFTEIVAVDVPEWLRNLRVYLEAAQFEDIVVEPGGVLAINEETIMARNLILHPGSRVIQRGMVTMDLSRSFRVVN